MDEGDGRMRSRRARQDEDSFEGIVPAKKSAGMIEVILTKAGNKDVTVKTFAEADHFIHVSKSGGPRETFAKGRVKTFAPDYLSTVTDWIAGRVHSMP